MMVGDEKKNHIDLLFLLFPFFLYVVNICYSLSLSYIDAVPVVCGCMLRENGIKRERRTARA
jgi:hypothetical protein